MRTVFAASLAALLPATALAFDVPVLHLDAELGYACYADDQRIHGGASGLDAGYAFDASWVIHAGYVWGEHRLRGQSFRAHQLLAGVRYQLDVFEYVPWIEVSPALISTSGSGGPGGVTAGAAIGLGFDRLLTDTWSVGFGVRYYQLAGDDRFPAYLTASARLGYRWVLGDPLAP